VLRRPAVPENGAERRMFRARSWTAARPSGRASMYLSGASAATRMSSKPGRGRRLVHGLVHELRSLISMKDGKGQTWVQYFQRYLPPGG
jgi:hypothetical protein